MRPPAPCRHACVGSGGTHSVRATHLPPRPRGRRTPRGVGGGEARRRPDPPSGCAALGARCGLPSPASAHATVRCARGRVCAAHASVLRREAQTSTRAAVVTVTRSLVCDSCDGHSVSRAIPIGAHAQSRLSTYRRPPPRPARCRALPVNMLGSKMGACAVPVHRERGFLTHRTAAASPRSAVVALPRRPRFAPPPVGSRSPLPRPVVAYPRAQPPRVAAAFPRWPRCRSRWRTATASALRS